MSGCRPARYAGAWSSSPERSGALTGRVEEARDHVPHEPFRVVVVPVDVRRPDP